MYINMFSCWGDMLAHLSSAVTFESKEPSIVTTNKVQDRCPAKWSMQQLNAKDGMARLLSGNIYWKG